MIIKKLLGLLAVAVISAWPVGLLAQNLEKDPGYLAIDEAFDFKLIKPEVNINLPKFLLNDALSDLNGGTNDPFAGAGLNISELIKEVKLIRVVVMEGKKASSEAVSKGVAKLCATLEKDWTPLAVVAEDNESVGLYAISDKSGDNTAGLAVVVHEKGSDAIIANIVGRVSIGKIIKAASQMNKLPKDFLKKLTNVVETSSAKKIKESSEKPTK